MKRVLGFTIVGFVLVITGLVSEAQINSAEPVPDGATISGGGKVNFLPIWKSGTTLGNSALFQHGQGSGALVGIGTTVPLGDAGCKRQQPDERKSDAIWLPQRVTHGAGKCDRPVRWRCQRQPDWGLQC